MINFVDQDNKTFYTFVIMSSTLNNVKVGKIISHPNYSCTTIQEKIRQLQLMFTFGQCSTVIQSTVIHSMVPDFKINFPFYDYL